MERKAMESTTDGQNNTLYCSLIVNTRAAQLEDKEARTGKEKDSKGKERKRKGLLCCPFPQLLACMSSAQEVFVFNIGEPRSSVWNCMKRSTREQLHTCPTEHVEISYIKYHQVS